MHHVSAFTLCVQVKLTASRLEFLTCSLLSNYCLMSSGSQLTSVVTVSSITALRFLLCFAAEGDGREGTCMCLVHLLDPA